VTGDTLIELQRFDDSHGSHRLASFIWDRLEGGADGEVVNQLFEATGELGQNVVEHAGSPVGGFVAAQRYKAGAPEERIIVAVGDAGIGIRESLRPRYGDMTDRQAITQAIRWNVSSVLEPGRGQGLPGIVDGVRGLGGVLWIRSGAASRTIRRGRATTVDVSRLQGTIVGARLPCRPGGRPERRRGPLLSTLIAPKLVSSRDQARELTASLGPDLSDTVVMVDCTALQASTPSFVDELVKSVLVDRAGDRLIIKGAPERTVELARRAAQNRGVVDRLETG
jgi:hypothetical protein